MDDPSARGSLRIISIEVALCFATWFVPSTVNYEKSSLAHGHQMNKGTSEMLLRVWALMRRPRRRLTHRQTRASTFSKVGFDFPGASDVH
jgi:hypothetical protein